MAIPKRRNQRDHDSPAAKKRKTNTTFTIDDFMADFPPTNEPLDSSNGPQLPSSVLEDDEMQDGKERKPPLRSTFNIKLPVQLQYHDNAPYDWMKKQYSHCIIPELGEEYNFSFESPTFYCLRDLHNARVRIRDGEYLPDYQICSLATRWICLEEEDRPASDGYLANGEIFVATCLPIGVNEDDALQQYFEMCYSTELSARHYIPRSKYSVHFVGQPNENENNEIQSVNVGSVLIRNTRTGQMVHIDTGALASRKGRARGARDVLRAWLEFEKEKCPMADIGPISDAEPLVLDVDKETSPSLRSIHALVSASLFLRRRITNWGDVTSFRFRGVPTSTTVANYALQNISGWLGLKSTGRRSKAGTKAANSFQDNYDKDALFGRKQPAPISQRIASAQKGRPPVYNEEIDLAENASDHEDSLTDSSSASSRNSVDSDQGTVVADQMINDTDVASGNEKSDSEVSKDKGSATKKSVSWKEPVEEDLKDEEPDEPTQQDSNGDDPNHEDVNGQKSSSDSETNSNDDNDQNSPAST